MSLHENYRMYPSMSALLDGALRTGESNDADIAPQIDPGRCISDMALYTQSNGRVMLGHDEKGRLHFISTAGRGDFQMPTLTGARDQLFSACPGMYNQADLSTFLGQIHYTLELPDGRVLSSGDEGSQTCYLDYFLPMTQLRSENMTLTSLSLCPIPEREAACAIPGLPLPGPSGAIHTLVVRNDGPETIKGIVQLHLSQMFCVDYQFCQSMKDDLRRPFQTEWNRNALFLWRPDACALIHAMGFSHIGNPSFPAFVQEMSLAPGEEAVYVVNVAVAADSRQLHPALAQLYRHTPLEWINLAASFWKERMGRLRDLTGDALMQRSMDFCVRAVLDNFNCYLFDESGELAAHQQGAPSHNSGRFWGIDAEPTALSVLYAVPEVIPSVLRYVSKRNEPLCSPYPEHSLPIFMAPMIIAAQYVALTGDFSAILDDAALRAELADDAKRLLGFRNSAGLLPSRYSSDGIVFNRYDFGTNCKGYCVFSAFAPVLRKMGLQDLANDFLEAAERLRRSVRDRLCVEGPFGPQYKGGANLGENDGFYMRDDLVYYDGEDSSSAMAPLYGITDYRDPLWQNYHRFARSLFATNYDPEVDALRWYPWGCAVDGTALISAMGGCATRDAMREQVKMMLKMGTDETGSLFWWPSAVNNVRGLTRCSQGQGAWVFQHTRQWLGLRLDAKTRTLDVQPQGPYTSYEWAGAHLGGAAFDLRVEETAEKLRLVIRNRNAVPYRVRLIGRGAGEAFSGAETAEGNLAPMGETVLETACPPSAEACDEEKMIRKTENTLRAKEGPCIATCLYSLPQRNADEPGVVILPAAVLTGPAPIRDANISVRVPMAFWAMAKTHATLDQHIDYNHVVHFELGDLPAYERVSRSVYLALPHKYQGCKVWMTRAPLAWLDQDDMPYEMMICSDSEEALGTIDLSLSWTEGEKEREVRCIFPVNAYPEDQFWEKKVALFGGRACSPFEPM